MTRKQKLQKLPHVPRNKLEVPRHNQHISSPHFQTLDGGQNVIQLETAVGAAIKSFDNALGINVPRSRFLPVKTTSDLLLVMSNLYSLDAGSLTMSPRREFPTTPHVKLGSSFTKVITETERITEIIPSGCMLLLCVTVLMPQSFWMLCLAKELPHSLRHLLLLYNSLNKNLPESEFTDVSITLMYIAIIVFLRDP